MVSLAILAVSLVAILNLHSGAVRMHNHAKFLTVATLLARSKMVDLEERIYSEDLSSFDQTLSGKFDDEGFPAYSWSAELVKPKLELDASVIEGLVTKALGLSPDGVEGGGSTGSGGPTTDAGGGLMGMLGGGMQSMITTQLSSLQQTIEDGVREVRLTLKWKDITGPSEMTVVTHVVKVASQGAPGSQEAQRQAATQKIIDDNRQKLGGLPNIPAVFPPKIPVPSASRFFGNRGKGLP